MRNIHTADVNSDRDRDLWLSYTSKGNTTYFLWRYLVEQVLRPGPVIL